MDCTQKVLTVFGTTRGTEDEEYKAPVWSVEVHDRTATTDPGKVALVADWPTSWVMSCDPSTPLHLNVGDVVRIGTVESSGYTDYLSVVEKVPLVAIGNSIARGSAATDTSVVLTYGSNKLIGPGAARIHGGVTYTASGWITSGTLTSWGPMDLNGTFDLVTTSDSGTDPVGTCVPRLTAMFPLFHPPGTVIPAGHHYAYRLNFAVNCTEVPRHITTRMTTGKTADINSLETRHTMTLEGRTPGYYPLRKVINGSKCSLQLDTGVKAIHWIKLVGYTLINGGSVGFQSTHEMDEDNSAVLSDDWVALHIKEIQGQVNSNNPSASGSFAVLHWGGARDKHSGAREYHRHEPEGLAFHRCLTPLSARTLTCTLTDRNGNPAHYGSVRLWFEVCVSHG